MEFPGNHKEKNESDPEAIINAAKDFAELEEALHSMRVIQGSSGEYSANVLIETIHSVRNGVATPKHITRTHGLREKVVALLAQERIKSAENFDELIAAINEIGEIPGSVKTYPAERVVDELKKLQAFHTKMQEIEGPLNYDNSPLVNRFTRNMGLRDKILELLHKAA